MEQNFKRQQPLMVTIRCIAYNQEAYIRDCLEGFVMQKTNFRFEAIVHDDASTDGTAAIIKEYAEKYPDIIKPILETENQYSKHDGSLVRIMDEHTHGKYVAFCEGDDYWIDPLKLQKQVDLLESNPDVGMVYTGFKRYYQKENKEIPGNGKQQYFDDLILSNQIQTNTVLLRSAILRQYEKEILPIAVIRKWKMGDTPKWLFVMAHSKTMYLPDVTGVYRILENSASHFTSFEKDYEFWESLYDCTIFFAKKYRPDSDLCSEIAVDQIERYLTMANIYKVNLKFPLYNHLKKYKIFTFKRYVSCKLRSFIWGRKFYVKLKR